MVPPGDLLQWHKTGVQLLDVWEETWIWGKKGIQKESVNQQLNRALSVEVNDEEENGGRIMEDSSKMKTKPNYWDISCLSKYGQMRRWRKLLLVKLIRKEVSLPFLAHFCFLAKIQFVWVFAGEACLEFPDE